MQGKIIKGIGGFYYVHDGHANVYECRAKGIFRNQNLKPLVGDNVEMDILDENTFTGNVAEILPRKNELIRPAVANVDQALVIFAARAPKPNFNLLDRFLVMMEQQNLPTIICFNKCDLMKEDETDEYCRIYQSAGYTVKLVSVYQNHGLDDLRDLLRGKTTVMAGPSGVGKSSLMNSWNPQAEMKTGEISRKIQRGKHTTRHSELFYMEKETFLMDTPGFTSLGLFLQDERELSQYYPEFGSFQDSCRFPDCVHVGERECGIKSAVEDGQISPIRYENYLQLYQEIKNTRKY
ncbi:MAG: ribosome small subunit-dependent GTPase A [Clostridiales bacterium]|nr:ribosome small subunit-dependent GTPase A [Clostridiales bacterium]